MIQYDLSPPDRCPGRPPLTARVYRRIRQLWWLALLTLVIAQPATAASPLIETPLHDACGDVVLYAAGENPKGLVLLLSDDTGWSERLQGMARDIAQLNYLVAGVDATAFRTREGANPDTAADLSALARHLASDHGLPVRPPILVGDGAGAAMVYAALAQAPTSAFHAGISLDFCPPPAQPLARLATTWFVFQAAPACDAETASEFVREIDNARLSIASRQAAATAGSPADWPQVLALLQWLDPGISRQVQADMSISGVPLSEVPARPGTHDRRLALMISGDGGWAELDRAVAARLADQGIATVGWDSLAYFWQSRTPAQAGADLERVLRHYLRTWDKDQILLIGYSFGAQVLPFMAERLAPDLRDKVRLVALLAAGPQATFEFHLSDWIETPEQNGLPVVPQVEKLDWTRRLCLYGDQENDSACAGLNGPGISVKRLTGDHHFDGDYAAVASAIEQAAE